MPKIGTAAVTLDVSQFFQNLTFLQASHNFNQPATLSISMICIPQVLKILYIVIVANISQIFALLCFDRFPLLFGKMRDFVKLS